MAPADTWVDRALDYLREHRLHPVVEVVLAWKVAISCLVYYGYSFVKGAIESSSTSSIVVPLTTIERRRNKQEESWCKELDRLCSMASAELIATIRNNVKLRRLVSKFILGARTHQSTHMTLRRQLTSVWPQLLEFPSIDVETFSFEISLVIPAYKEPVDRILWTLEQALQRCSDDPAQIQVILVVVVESKEYEAVSTKIAPAWGELLIVKYDGGGGRGPCQNHGASLARGKLLTFLHADTLLPIHWDRKVKDTLLPRPGKRRTTQACAFAFGHNTSFLDGMPYPWGIRSVWLLGNLRAYFFSLPYGDHIISIPTAFFRYIGGFPNQPIMEDYELMDILRRRAKILPECIEIIPPPTGRCSVRRWQRFGVVYVTLVNALLVQRYAHGGWTADDVYEYYYERPFVK